MSNSVYVGFNGDIDSQLLAILLTKQGFTVKGVYYSVNIPQLSLLPTHLQSKFSKNQSSLKLKAKDLNIELEIIDVSQNFVNDIIDQVITSRLEFKYINYSQLVLSFLVNCCHTYNKEFALGYYVKFLLAKDRPSILMHSDSTIDQSDYFSNTRVDRIRGFIFPLGELSHKEKNKLVDNFKLQNTESTTLERVGLEGFVAESLKRSIKIDDQSYSNFDFKLSDYHQDTTSSFNFIEAEAINIKSTIFELKNSTVSSSIQPKSVSVKYPKEPILQDALLIFNTNNQLRLEFTDPMKFQLGQSVAIYESNHKNAKLIGSAELFNILDVPV